MFIDGVGERAAITPVFLRAADGGAIDIGLTSRVVGRIHRNPSSIGKVVNHMRLSGVNGALGEGVIAHETIIIGVNRCHAS